MVAASLYGGSMYTGGREVMLLWVCLPYKFSLNMKRYFLVTAPVTLVSVAQR